MHPQNKAENKRRMVLLTAVYGCLVYQVALVLTLTTLALLFEVSHAFAFGFWAMIMLIIILFGQDVLLMSLLVGLLIGLFITFRQPKSLWHVAGGGALIGFVVGVVLAGITVGIGPFPDPASIGFSGASTLAGMLSALAVGRSMRRMR